MRKFNFNFVLRMDPDKGPNISQGQEFAKMKEQFEPTPGTTQEGDEFDLEKGDLNRNGDLTGKNAEVEPVQTNTIPDNIISQGEEPSSENPLDAMTKGILGDVDLNKDNEKEKTTDAKIDEIINPKDDRDNDNSNVQQQNLDVEIERILSPEQRDEIVKNVLDDPELGKLIDQTMEKAQNGELYMNMDKLTDDLIKELKEYEGNEKEAYKNIIQELFKSMSIDKIDRAELQKIDLKTLIALDTEEIQKALGEKGTEKEVNQKLEDYGKKIENIFDQREIDFKDLPKSMRKALGYEEIESDSLNQVIDNINLLIDGKEDGLDEILRRRLNEVMEIVHSIESERISMEKARMENDNIASWSSLWNDERENYLQMSSPELQKTLTDLIKECDLMKKALKERQDFGKIGDNISKEIDEYYKNDSKGAEKRNFLKNAESDDINALLAVCQKRASNIQEIIQKQSGESQNTKRSSFIAVQYQKIDAILKESEKDPKFNALKEIDDLREGHKDIPRELIDNAYKVFDVEKYSERKAAINEFIETGNVKEQQEKRSISIDAVKSDFKSSYQEGSPEGVACKVGISSLSNAVEYNKHLFGVIERIEKPVEKTPELGGVSMEEKTDNKHLAALQQSQKEGIGGGRGQS